MQVGGWACPLATMNFDYVNTGVRFRSLKNDIKSSMEIRQRCAVGQLDIGHLHDGLEILFVRIGVGPLTLLVLLEFLLADLVGLRAADNDLRHPR